MGESHTFRDSEREIARLLKVFSTRIGRASLQIAQLWMVILETTH